jgi:hypothetical protein
LIKGALIKAVGPSLTPTAHIRNSILSKDQACGLSMRLGVDCSISYIATEEALSRQLNVA